MAATLEKEELDALISAIQDGRVASDQGQAPADPRVRPCDLTSREHRLRADLPALDALHEKTAAGVARRLSARTRLTLAVATAPAALVEAADLPLLLAPPATVESIALGPGLGEAFVVLDPSLADQLLAAALGDRNPRPPDPAAERRPRTAVESLILRRIVALVGEALAEGWAQVIRFEPEVRPFDVGSIPRGEGEAAVLFQLAVDGPLAGWIQLVLPGTAVEPARRQLVGRSGGTVDPRFTAALTRELGQVEVELAALLGSTELRLAKLLELQPGDLLALDTEEGMELPVLIEGRRKLAGEPLVRGANLAVRLAGPLQHEPTTTRSEDAR